MLPSAAVAGVPQVERSNTGGAVTSTEASVPAAVAMSAGSTRDTPVGYVPSAVESTSTVAVTLARPAPGSIGAAVETQLSSRLLSLRSQLQPVTLGDSTNISPAARVAVRVGWWYAGPAGAPPSAV